MNMLSRRGDVIYGITSLAAFLCALPVCLVLLVGFAYAGLASDTPGNGGVYRYSVIVAIVFSATILLFIGLLGTSSRRQTFSTQTMIGSGLLLLLIGAFTAAAVRGRLLVWALLILMIELAALSLSFIKLKQLRSAR